MSQNVLSAAVVIGAFNFEHFSLSILKQNLAFKARFHKMLVKLANREDPDQICLVYLDLFGRQLVLRFYNIYHRQCMEGSDKNLTLIPTGYTMAVTKICDKYRRCNSA